MRTSSRIKQKRIQQEEIERTIAIQLAKEIEEEDKRRKKELKEQTQRKQADELALKQAKVPLEVLELESSLHDTGVGVGANAETSTGADADGSAEVDDTTASVATTCTSTASPSSPIPLSPSSSPSESEKHVQVHAHEVVKKKKKAPPKFKIKPKIQQEEIDISNTTIEIVTAKAADIRKSRSNSNNTTNNIKTSKSHQKQLIHIPSKNERSIIYEETAKAIAIKECQALPPYGGRPWKCIVIVSDDMSMGGSASTLASGIASSLKGEVVQLKDYKKPCPNGKGKGKGKGKNKKGKSSPAPLFRWYRGKLELACLPHIFEQIDTYDVNRGLLKSVQDEYSVASTLMKEDEKSTDLTCRTQHTILSTVAWNATHHNHSKPCIERKWISPDHVMFRSRVKTMEHCAMLDERDKMIDKVLHGIGLRGASIRPVKPTRKLALEAGYYRFLRDGLWVVGQEEEWIKHRIEDLDAEYEDANTDFAKGAKIAKFCNDKIANDNCGKINGGNENEEIQKAKEGNDTLGEGHSTVNTENQKGEICNQRNNGENNSIGNEQKACLKKADPTTVSDHSINCEIATEDDTNNIHVGNNSSSHKRKREYCFIPSQHWRLTKNQIALCKDEIMDHYEKVSYTIKARALHSELADGFDVFRQRGTGRYDMQLPAFDTDLFSFLTDLEKASWMPVVKKILGDDATIVHKGAFLSLPGSSTQIYHQDGPHLTTKYQRPCHAINVFIPLVDLSMKNGPTEFCIGTHMLGYEHYSKEMLDTPLAPAGSPVIFDYRLGHRGLGNSSQEARPILYLTYTSASKEFRDSVNFSRKRYRKLGDLVERPLTRKERAIKRARDID